MNRWQRSLLERYIKTAPDIKTLELAAFCVANLKHPRHTMWSIWKKRADELKCNKLSLLLKEPPSDDV